MNSLLSCIMYCIICTSKRMFACVCKMYVCILCAEWVSEGVSVNIDLLAISIDTCRQLLMMSILIDKLCTWRHIQCIHNWSVTSIYWYLSLHSKSERKFYWLDISDVCPCVKQCTSFTCQNTSLGNLLMDFRRHTRDFVLANQPNKHNARNKCSNIVIRC